MYECCQKNSHNKAIILPRNLLYGRLCAVKRKVQLKERKKVMNENAIYVCINGIYANKMC